MPAAILMIAVDWYGPFKSLASAKKVSVETGVSEFLYLAVSTDGADKSYIGLSGNASGRLTESHHVLGGLEEGEIDIWIGLVSSQTEAGRKPSGANVSHSAALHLAEHIIAYFVQTSENKRKRRNPPDRSGVVFSRWFQDAPPWERRGQRGHKQWPDFIEFDYDQRLARLVWFGREMTKYSGKQIDDLKRES